MKSSGSTDIISTVKISMRSSGSIDIISTVKNIHEKLWKYRYYLM